jgi:hypothetical protein
VHLTRVETTGRRLASLPSRRREILVPMAKSDDYINPDAKAAARKASAESHTDLLSVKWREDHAARTAALEKELLEERPGATRAERLLVHLAAHDGALSERIADAELQLCERLTALVDNPGVGLSLARALQRTIACREACARRLRDLLQAAAVLRAQRKLTEKTHLKAVA